MPQRYQPTLAELATAYGLHGTPLYVSQLQAQRADGALVTAYAQWCTDGHERPAAARARSSCSRAWRSTCQHLCPPLKICA